jgi:hypothetical protein
MVYLRTEKVITETTNFLSPQLAQRSLILMPTSTINTAQTLKRFVYSQSAAGGHIY